MIITALVRTAVGAAPVAESAHYQVRAEGVAQAAMILLLLRAFSSGCSALTGVEAVANGVPAFRTPKIRNARTTLLMMGGIAVFLFAGLMLISLIAGVHYAENPCDLIGWKQCATQPQRSLIAQLASATFGNNSIPFFIVQAATAVVLLLAANTAFNGFPLLGSVLARDSYAPKALSTRGDRLVFSNGVIALALAAILLLIIYQANLTNLIQLYIIGVFVSFTLGQSGMVKHWITLLRGGARERVSIIRSLCINAFGAVLTFSVLVVVTITKFTHGAWLVFIMMPVLFLLMLGVNRYYRDVAKEVEVDPTTTFGSSGDHAVVLVGKMQKPVLKALDYAIAARHQSIEAVHISVDEESTEALQKQWRDMNIHVPLTIIESPYRDFGIPLIKYIKHRREENGAEVVTVYTPQYIVGHWWEGLLHNHAARRIRHKLMLVHGVTIALVPWLLDSSELIYGRRSRPLPGQDRRGEPIRAEIGGAERSYLAGFHERVERRRAFLPRRRGIVLMSIIEVDRLDAEPGERRIDTLGDRRLRKAGAVAHLGRDQHAAMAAATLQPLADDRFRFAAAIAGHPGRIDVGRVDHHAARFGEAIEDAEAVLARFHRPAEDIAAEHEPGRRQPAFTQGPGRDHRSAPHCPLAPLNAGPATRKGAGPFCRAGLSGLHDRAAHRPAPRRDPAGDCRQLGDAGSQRDRSRRRLRGDDLRTDRADPAPRRAGRRHPQSRSGPAPPAADRNRGAQRIHPPGRRGDRRARLRSRERAILSLLSQPQR